MADPTPISAKQISEAAKRAVAAALDKRKDKFPKAAAPAGIYLFPPWWIGFILQEINLEETSAGTLTGIAKEVATSVAGSIPAVKGAEVGAVIHNGHVTIGFIAPPEIRSISE